MEVDILQVVTATLSDSLSAQIHLNYTSDNLLSRTQILGARRPYKLVENSSYPTQNRQGQRVVSAQRVDTSMLAQALNMLLRGPELGIPILTYCFCRCNLDH